MEQEEYVIEQVKKEGDDLAEELKACPECKTTNHLNVWETDLGQYFVRCESCFTQGATRAYREGAIAAWNRRMNDD